jgi:hypothetical protein
MVAESAVRIRSGRYGHVENVLFAEAMLVHVRLLANFLYGPIEKSDRDVQRTDFAVEWTAQPTSDTACVNTHYPGIDKHLAHLSWTRVTQGTPDWPLDLADALVRVAAEWAKHLRQEGEEEWADIVTAKVATAKAILATVPMVTTTPSGLLVFRTN